MIELLTLGRGAVRRDGEDLPGITAQKQRFALLAYLAVERRASRAHLLALFWPEREEEKARHSLSQAIYALKRELGEEVLRVEGDSVQADAEACTVDARLLEAAAERGDWQRVIELYKGPFLDQFSLPDAGDFEEWLSNTRTGLARLVHQGFRIVIAEQARSGDMAAALADAWRWTTLEPLDDEAQHTLIGLLAATGDRTAALSRFEAYRERLTREFEVEPLEETLALVERVRAGEAPEFRPLSETTRPPHKRVPAAPEAGETQPSADGAPSSLEALWRQVRTRRVFHVGLLYLGASWLAMQVTDILIERGLLPNSFFSALLLVLVAVLPVALILAWAYEQPPGERWAYLIRKVGPLHVLAALFAAALLLLPARFLLNRQPQGTAIIEAGAPPSPTSIAVFYFDDHSEGEQLGYLAESLTEHLIHELAQVSALDVKSRNAVKPFRNGSIMPDSAATLLGVGTLVEGSVTGTRERVRISVQLIDASTLNHIDSDLIDGSAEDPFALLDTVGSDIAQMLRTSLGVEVRLREMRAGTEDRVAWEHVRRAQALLEDVEDLIAMGDTAEAARAFSLADQLLADAEDAAPDWIEPIVARAELASQAAEDFAPADRTYDIGWVQRGMRHADRALDLAPDDPGALEARGTLLAYLAAMADVQAAADSLLVEAATTLRRAADLDATRASAWSQLSRVLQRQAEFAEAKWAAERAYEEDAFLADATRILFLLCQNSIELRDWAEVTRWCSEGRRRFPDRGSFVAAQLTALAGPEGPEPDVSTAWQLGEKMLELSPPQRQVERRPRVLMEVAAVLARAGRPDSARAVIELARASVVGSDPETDYYEANARLHLGENERALELLAAYLEAVPGERDYMASDWWWQRLWDDPRFQQLVAHQDQL
jgi:DNA-binding SARP family transcriptional activator/TolB-like protein/tetratricopeptide (TPR) repeat protein